MNNRNASWDDIWRSFAKYVSAVSFPIGGIPTFDNSDRFNNLNFPRTESDGGGRNACVIDCSKAPHHFWFWDESSGIPVWTKKEKGAVSW